MSPPLADLVRAALAFRDRRDWKQFHKPKDLVLGLAAEAGELAECFLWKTEAEIQESLATASGRARVAEELADVMIYLIYLADATGVDLAEAVRKKIRINEGRYPVEKARGSAKKYTELGG